MDGEARGRVLVAGDAAGELLVLDEPLSFWGGVDAATGEIVDRRHPQHGARVVGRVLALPGGRGSSSSSSTLAEMARRGTAPAALLLEAPDPIMGLGAVVARELYGIELPVVTLPSETYRRLVTGRWAAVDRDGRVWMPPPPDAGV